MLELWQEVGMLRWGRVCWLFVRACVRVCVCVCLLSVGAPGHSFLYCLAGRPVRDMRKLWQPVRHLFICMPCGGVG